MTASRTEIRAVAPVDALERDGELLALVGERVVLVSPLGRSILRAADAWRTESDLVRALGAEFGPPPAGGGTAIVREAVVALAAEGLVEVRGRR